MTAEVAVLNRQAVAIAADSAVTLGAAERDQRKIYNTANKIFVLSEIEPVAVMVYGAGSFGPIPWETVVKEYRRAIANISFPTVEDYASEFVAHLATLVPHVSEDEQLSLVVETIQRELRDLHASTQAIAAETCEHGGEPPDEYLQDVLTNLLTYRRTQLESMGFVDGLADDFVEALIVEAIESWDEVVDSYLPDLPVDDRIRTELRRLVRAAIRCASGSSRLSGVVFAGFGRSQLFPALSHYHIDGVVAQRVRFRHVDSVEISEQSSAEVRAFAQGDMVATFMEGIDPGHRVEVHRFFDETLGRFIEHFGDQIQHSLDGIEYNSLIAKMRELQIELSEYWNQSFDKYVEQNNSAPIMSIVALLPKEELAELAEALVNLTSFKRRVTPAAETVGGPIDVAVISKGDGLVWLKRKHYFPPELNPRYFRRLGFDVSGRVGIVEEES